MKQCKDCGSSKLALNYKSVKGKEYYKPICNSCRRKRKLEKGWVPKKRKYDSKGEREKAYKEKQRKRRLDPSCIPSIILEDCRKVDKKKRLDNDLDLSFVEAAIRGCCLYCGENRLRMSLDRINNDKGHTKDNVIAACVRCNYLRRDMPFAAWLCLLNGLHKARESGYFKDWVGGCWPGNME